ncbi:MAG: YfcC family protein [Clostridia bacterium]|nr:YfcC family protein [Clostridia bacterium]
MGKNKEGKGLNVSIKSYVTAIAVILALMILTYALTFVIPGGEYVRIDVNGKQMLDSARVFRNVEGGISLGKWLASPVLVLGAEGGGTIIAIIAFLLVIGGVFTALDSCGLMKYMLDKIVARFGAAKYKLLAIVTFFFMAMGAFIGSFEECIPMVPIVVALSVNLGWDAMTGMGMSLLAVGCGFASGVCNPFTVGVAQSLASLPMFSGIWLRIVAFAVIYTVLVLFVYFHAKKVEKKELGTVGAVGFTPDKRMDRALVCFAGILSVGILFVISSGFIKALQDYTMIIVALAFLVAGIASVLLAGTKLGSLGRDFGKGIVNILPAVLLLLFASSIKYTLTEAKILDTVLHWCVEAMDGMPGYVIVLFVYLIVLVMNFFISSGSAKAFLLIPLIVPMAQLFNVEPQLCVVAFAFGDGFSNVFYPTNAALLIALGLTGISYGKWIKYSWKFQLINLFVTSLMLLFGHAVNYH